MTFSLAFHQNKLYRLDGVWYDLDNEHTAKELLQSFVIKYGEPNSVAPIATTREWNDVFHPLRREYYQWNDGVTLLEIKLETFELPLSLMDNGKPQTGVASEFSLSDQATSRTVKQDVENRNYPQFGTCVFLLFKKYGEVTLPEKVSLSGLDVAIHNPDALPAALWIAFCYFLARYLQYFISEGYSGSTSH